jgi:YtkA-like
MHLRMAWVASGRRLRPIGALQQPLLTEQIVWARRVPQVFQLVVVCGVLGFACGQSPGATAARNGGDVASDLTFEWTMTANPPTVGTDTVGEVTMRDRSKRPVRGATLQIECHMSHPGMAPVVGQAIERSEGVYQVPLRFSMIGEWVVIVKGTLPDGRRFDRRIETATVRQAR